MPNPSDKKPAQDTPSLTSNNQKTILVVEDECSVRETVVRNLEFLGYRVLQAKNGEEGLSISRLHGKAIDLVFTDAVMPRLSGPRMVDSLRKEKINTPVLYTTGYADTHGISREQQVLTKPYTANELAAKIQEFIGTAHT